MTEYLVKSLGYGIHQVGADDALTVRSVAEQIGHVLEVWPDPDDPTSYTVVLESGFATSWFEGSVAIDPGTAATVKRAVRSSPDASKARERLSLVSLACSTIFGESYDASILEP